MENNISVIIVSKIDILHILKNHNVIMSMDIVIAQLYSVQKRPLRETTVRSKMQYLQIQNIIVDTSIKHPISGQSTTQWLKVVLVHNCV